MLLEEEELIFLSRVSFGVSAAWGMGLIILFSIIFFKYKVQTVAIDFSQFLSAFDVVICFVIDFFAYKYLKSSDLPFNYVMVAILAITPIFIFDIYLELLSFIKIGCKITYFYTRVAFLVLIAILLIVVTFAFMNFSQIVFSARFNFSIIYIIAIKFLRISMFLLLRSLLVILLLFDIEVLVRTYTQK